MTLRRRYQLWLSAMLILFGGCGMYAKRYIDTLELELRLEHAAAVEQKEAMQQALDKARAEVESLQLFPRSSDLVASPKVVAASSSSHSLPSAPAPHPALRTSPTPTPISPPSNAPMLLVPPSDEGTLERLLQYIDTRAQPPPNALNIIIMGSKQMVHRDKQFYLDAFHSIGFETTEIGDASNPLTPWQPSDPGWSGILCLSLTDGEDKCLHKRSYAGLRRYQRIGRLPGLRHVLWNKDAFCRTLKALGTRNDKAEIIESPVTLDSFSFYCWIVPAEYDALQQWGSDHRGQQYIVKPIAAGEGIGIKLLSDISATAPYATVSQSHVIQPYLSNPLLIHGFKFDIRSYVLVTSVSPLRAYMYGEGLVRFASTAYKQSGQGAVDATGRMAFLTNTAVNKRSGKSLSNLTWSFAQLRDYATNEGKDVEQVFDAMHSVVVYTLLVAEPAFLNKWKQQAQANSGQELHCSQHCYHLLGVDIIFDNQWHPRVIEVNGEPSMKPATHEKSSSPYNLLKRHMTTDLVALVYGSPEQRGQISALDTGTATSSTAVLAVLRQLVQHRVGVFEIDCDASMKASLGGAARWEKGDRHDTCVWTVAPAYMPHRPYPLFILRNRYLLRSQREWNDRGQFHRIYPRPPRRNTPRGDEVERLLGYIGLMYPEYVRGRNAVTLTPATAVAQAGVALGETSWMVDSGVCLDQTHELLSQIEGDRE